MSLCRQRGALRLHWIALAFLVLAAAAMTALFSMRQDRNLFTIGADKLGTAVDNSTAGRVFDAASDASGANGGPMRKCVINGKTVVSNTDCSDQNPTSKTIKIQVTRGVEAPKLPPAPPAETPSNKQQMDKWIDKQSQ